MKSCTIIISHFESLPFLRACIRQIRKHKNDEIRQQIIIADQSKNRLISETVKSEFEGKEDIVIVHCAPLYSGYGIDYIMRNKEIETDYIAQIHVDAMPIHKNWLLVPIEMIQKFDLSFAGQFQFVSDGTPAIYPPEPFCAMSQCFNVARTETYHQLSFNAGFTRFHNRGQSGFTFPADDWAQWAKKEYNSRGSDDDVVAFHWQDKHNQVVKLDLAITGMIGSPEDGSSYGRVIDDLVFHFGSCREAVGVLDKMPKKYQRWTEVINNEGFDDELLKQLLLNVKPHTATRQLWDGRRKKAYPAGTSIDLEVDFLKSEP